uniref:Smr domain-containing protein n=1 Tax=Globodera pallida TaxID=36090 RepID=A0A183C9F9_GLOPA
MPKRVHLRINFCADCLELRLQHQAKNGGGYVYMDVPHKERTFDQALPRTPLAELLDRHAGKRLPTNPVEAFKPEGHKSVWITEDLLELCKHFNWNVVKWRNVDDKVGNGFTIVIKK